MSRLFLLIFFLLLNGSTQAMSEDEAGSGAGAASEVSSETEKPAQPEKTERVSPAPTVAVEPKETSQPLSAFALGIHGGQSFTNITDPGFSTKADFSAGASLDVKFLENWFLLAEANYLSKGYRGVDGVSQNTAALHYIELPVFLKMRLPWTVLSPSFLVGPAVAYLHSSQITQSGITTDTTSSTNRFEYTFYVGAGADLMVSERIELSVNARYGWGLSDINSGFLQADVFNRVFLVVAGIQYRL